MAFLLFRRKQIKKEISQIETENAQNRQAYEKAMEQYSLNVLSEKYRTLAAVSELYEYFVSGRVTELEGSDGAYELYESELSQGLITDKMYFIISQLDDIKDHQSALYNELKETKQIVTDIDGDVSRIIFAEPDAGDAAIITDYCSSIQSSNESALQYIEEQAKRQKSTKLSK